MRLKAISQSRVWHNPLLNTLRPHSWKKGTATRASRATYALPITSLVEVGVEELQAKDFPSLSP